MSLHPLWRMKLRTSHSVIYIVLMKPVHAYLFLWLPPRWVQFYSERNQAPRGKLQLWPFKLGVYSFKLILHANMKKKQIVSVCKLCQNLFSIHAVCRHSLSDFSSLLATQDKIYQNFYELIPSPHRVFRIHAVAQKAILINNIPIH